MSPGGLPKGITLDEYLSGGISIPRNPIICSVFLRLKMIERFGTGIRRIGEAYNDYLEKPRFHVTDNMIKVILPIIEENNNGLEENERIVLKYLKDHGSLKMSSSEVAKAVGLGKTKIVAIMGKLVDAGYVEKNGMGRGTKYKAR